MAKQAKRARGPRSGSKSGTKKKRTRKSSAKKVKSSKKKFDEDAFYKKYPHVVKGSVKEVKPGTEVGGITAVHGRICKIKCQESGKLRTINVQDAFQVKFSAEVQKKKARQRAAARRKKKAKAAKKAS